MNIQKEYTERELIEKDLKLMVYYVNEGLIGNRMLWMYPSMILKGNMYVCMYVQCPWSVWDPLELELQVMIHLIWMLGTKHSSFGRGEITLNC